MICVVSERASNRASISSERNFLPSELFLLFALLFDLARMLYADIYEDSTLVHLKCCFLVLHRLAKTFRCLSNPFGFDLCSCLRPLSHPQPLLSMCEKVKQLQT